MTDGVGEAGVGWPNSVGEGGVVRPSGVGQAGVRWPDGVGQAEVELPDGVGETGVGWPSMVLGKLKRAVFQFLLLCFIKRLVIVTLSFLVLGPLSSAWQVVEELVVKYMSSSTQLIH